MIRPQKRHWTCLKSRLAFLLAAKHVDESLPEGSDQYSVMSMLKSMPNSSHSCSSGVEVKVVLAAYIMNTLLWWELNLRFEIGAKTESFAVVSITDLKMLVIRRKSSYIRVYIVPTSVILVVRNLPVLVSIILVFVVPVVIIVFPLFANRAAATLNKEHYSSKLFDYEKPQHPKPHVLAFAPLCTS